MAIAPYPRPEGSAAPRLGALRSLRHYNYRLWAGGALVSNVGTWMQRTAQDWLVLTQLTHHDARAVGLVMALQFAPQLLLLPVSGFAADRMERRKLLMFTQAAMAILSLALAVLVITGAIRLWQVYIFAFLFGSAAAIDAPARQTFVGDLVGERDLANAVALNSTSFNAARMVGPAVAGLCIGAIGTGWAFMINGVSFVGVLVSLFFMRSAELTARTLAPRRKGAFLEGFRYVWQRDDLRTIMVMLFLIGTFGLNFPIFISTMAVQVFHAGAQGYGLLSSAVALGTVTGAFMAARRDRAGFGHLVYGSGLFALGCGLAALAPDYVLFAGALVVIGFAALTVTNASNTLMQLSSDPQMRGRVMAIRVGLALGGTPVGAPLVGWVAHAMGPRWSLGVAVLAGLSAFLIGARYCARRQAG